MIQNSGNNIGNGHQKWLKTRVTIFPLLKMKAEKSQQFWLNASPIKESTSEKCAG